MSKVEREESAAPPQPRRGITSQALAVYLAEYEKAAEKFRQTERATSIARSAECAAQNDLNDRRKAYQEAYDKFLKEHDLEEWPKLQPAGTR